MTHATSEHPLGTDDLAAQRERLKRVVAHDLRNPIAALIGFAALIEDANALGDEERYFLERLKDTTIKLHYAAGDLIELAWIEAEMPVRREPVAFAEVVQRAAALANDDRIELAPTDTQITVLGDSDQLVTAVTKLLSNALTYSAPQTPVTLRIWVEDDRALLAVTDSGFGIAQEEQENVFDRLYRSKDPRVKAIPAGGLGLTVARKIARHFGGDVSLTSALNAGSTFVLWLPLAQSPAS
jgi:two-component system sensor histidine kinase SenX3